MVKKRVRNTLETVSTESNPEEGPPGSAAGEEGTASALPGSDTAIEELRTQSLDEAAAPKVPSVAQPASSTLLPVLACTKSCQFSGLRAWALCTHASHSSGVWQSLGASVSKAGMRANRAEERH
jgi:hypothetical protein